MIVKYVPNPVDLNENGVLGVGWDGWGARPAQTQKYANGIIWKTLAKNKACSLDLLRSFIREWNKELREAGIVHRKFLKDFVVVQVKIIEVFLVRA